jgi:hypothetical protein
LGTISSGYGAGKLTKFDDGTCNVKTFSSKHIVVDFKGRKIKGIYHFINTGVASKDKYKQQRYFLFKGKL